MKKYETRNGCISHRGVHFEILHQGEWKGVTVTSRSVIVHHGKDLPQELQEQILRRTDRLFQPFK